MNRNNNTKNDILYIISLIVINLITILEITCLIIGIVGLALQVKTGNMMPVYWMKLGVLGSLLSLFDCLYIALMCNDSNYVSNPVRRDIFYLINLTRRFFDTKVRKLVFTDTIDTNTSNQLSKSKLVPKKHKCCCSNDNKEKLSILFNKLNSQAIIPKKRVEDAGYDIYAIIPDDFVDGYIEIKPHTTVLVPTGLRSVIPNNYYIQIQERGSTGSKGIKYSAGVIDSNYRGEWFLATTNTNDRTLFLYDGNDQWVNSFKETNKDNTVIQNAIFYPTSKALFQGIIHCVHNEINSYEVSDSVYNDYESNRGTGSLGSSGK